MADKITAERRSENMRRIRAQNSKPELLVRKLLHNAGYRYRLHGKTLPGKPDIVFSARRKVIFVHGCFWHQHDAVECLDGRRPKSNTGYWNSKLARNVERDALQVERLKAAGWTVLVVWECETQDLPTLVTKLTAFLENSQ